MAFIYVYFVSKDEHFSQIKNLAVLSFYLKIYMYKSTGLISIMHETMCDNKETKP